jgi:hypothetical protein
MPDLDVLLIYPPVAKPAEPPAGVAHLKSALLKAEISCTVIDANVEALHYLIRSVREAKLPRSRSALRNREKNLRTIRSLEAYKKFDHYKRSVLELNRLLVLAGEPFETAISFTDYKQKDAAPVRSHDLIRTAGQPEHNAFFDYFQSTLLPRIDELAPQVFGISLIYLSQAVTTFALIGLLRRSWPKTKIILGGGLVTSWMSQPNWCNPFAGLVDDFIAGRGEEQLLKYLHHSTAKGSHPRANYEDVEWSCYFSPGRILPYSASFGCYWRRCTFCPECAEGNAFDPTPTATVIHDLQALAAHKPRLIHFLDNAITPSLLKKLAVTPLPAPWYGYVRFTPELEDIHFCQALRKAGCVMLQLGLESGNQSVLDSMKKGIDLKRVSVILQNLKKAGISTFVYLLFGTPYESMPEARDTVQFVVDHADFIDYINPAIFNMPVFSEEAAAHETRVFYKGDLTLYHDFDHPHAWSRSQVRQFLQKEFRAHPLIKKILAANPPSFTSNHAPFFASQFFRG